MTANQLRQFQNASQGCPGLTNGKARSGDCRAIRFASDPATLENSGFETAFRGKCLRGLRVPTKTHPDEGEPRQFVLAPIC